MKLITSVDHYGNTHKFKENKYINRVALYGLLKKDGSLLMVQDAKSQKWELPGGGKDEGENQFDCLKREFFEETGLEINSKIKFLTSFESYFFDITSKQPWKTLRKFYIVTTSSDQTPFTENHKEIKLVRFAHHSQINTLAMSKEIRRVVSEFLAKEILS